MGRHNMRKKFLVNERHFNKINICEKEEE